MSELALHHQYFYKQVIQKDKIKDEFDRFEALKQFIDDFDISMIKCRWWCRFFGSSSFILMVDKTFNCTDCYTSKV